MGLGAFGGSLCGASDSLDENIPPSSRVACWLPIMRSFSLHPSTSVIVPAILARRSA